MYYFKKVPDSSKSGGFALVKAGKVETGHTNKALDVKPAAPAKPAVDSNGASGGNRTSVKPVNGSYRTAVEQGKDGKVTPSSGMQVAHKALTPVIQDILLLAPAVKIAIAV